MAARPIPQGYHALTPYLTVQGAAKLVDFLKKAFGAEQSELFKRPDGTIAHTMLQIGDSRLMISDASEKMPANRSSLYHYVNDVDATFKRALAAGGKSTMDVSDMFYGDRVGSLTDPCGNTWTIATHKEDVSAGEVEKRFKAFLQQQKAA